jgi:hypothetical protein
MGKTTESSQALNKIESGVNRRGKVLCESARRYELGSRLLSGHAIRQELSDADLGFLAATLDDLGIPRDQLCIISIGRTKLHSFSSSNDEFFSSAAIRRQSTRVLVTADLNRSWALFCSGRLHNPSQQYGRRARRVIWGLHLKPVTSDLPGQVLEDIETTKNASPGKLY